MISTKSARITFLIFFGVLVAAFLYMASPLMKPVFLALIFAVVFYPVYKFFLKLFRNHNYIASIVTTILSFCVVLVPIVFLISMLSGNLVEFAHQLANEMQGAQMAPIVDKIGNFVNEWMAFLPGTGDATFDLRAEIIEFLKTAGKFAYQFSPKVITTAIKTGMSLIVLIIFLVVFFAEGSNLFEWFVNAMPLSSSHQEEISKDIRVMISATLLGMIANALVQGVLIGIGFLVAGFSDAIMWGMVAVLAAFIPIIGAASCYIAASLVLLAMGRPEAAIIFLIYGIGFVSTIDNVIKPLVMGGQMRVHPVLLFVALLGGVRVFGPIGIIFGPVLLALFLASLRIYQREFTTS